MANSRQNIKHAERSDSLTHLSNQRARERARPPTSLYSDLRNNLRESPLRMASVSCAALRFCPLITSIDGNHQLATIHKKGRSRCIPLYKHSWNFWPAEVAYTKKQKSPKHPYGSRSTIHPNLPGHSIFKWN